MSSRRAVVIGATGQIAGLCGSTCGASVGTSSCSLVTPSGSGMVAVDA